jgi:hypothetical protein
MPLMSDLKLPARKTASVKPLWEGAEWDFALIDRVYEQMKEIGLGEMGLSICSWCYGRGKDPDNFSVETGGDMSVCLDCSGTGRPVYPIPA